MLIFSVIVTVLFCFFMAVTLFLMVKDGYFTKIFVKLGWKEQTARLNWTALSWTSMLTKLHMRADVVFFGDSITRGGDFHLAFPGKTIVNLGLSGDTLAGMIQRISMVQAVHPDRVFFLGGINGLTDFNVEKTYQTYQKLISELRKALPNTKIYLQSVLPIAPQKERAVCKNETIRALNQKIKELAEREKLPYIDLYPLYEKNGVMDPALTKDGIHLHPQAYDRWMKALQTYIA